MFGNSKKSDVSIEGLLEDLQAVIADAESLLRATAHQAGEKVQEAREQAEATILAARKRLLRLKKTALKRGTELVEDTDEYVHENPWRVIGIAAGAGLLIGLLCSLNRR